MIFQGEFKNSIDPKGRASIPAKFREVLNEVYGDDRLIVTKNLEDGLTAYPPSSWKTIVQKVKEAPNGPTKNSAIRLMIAPSAECTFDKNGRIQLPLALRTEAGLEKDVVVVGMFEKIEIYSHARYAEVTRKSKEILQSDEQAFAEMGF